LSAGLTVKWAPNNESLFDAHQGAGQIILNWTGIDGGAARIHDLPTVMDLGLAGDDVGKSDARTLQMKAAAISGYRD
jgi:hypothetical protein